jgi:hypothetical protein
MEGERGGFTAVIRVTGRPQHLEGFRERVRWLLVRDIDAEPYSEHHGPDRLEYRFEIERGIPFPAFATASLEFPELHVEAEWRDAPRAASGRAVIEGGRLLENERGALEERRALGVDVAVSPRGELLLALACRAEGSALFGYAASAGRHAYFRFEQGRLRLAEDAGERWSTDGAPIGKEELAALEDLAFEFASDWLWYDEAPAEETALERKRYAEHGYVPGGANLKSEQLLRLREAGRQDDDGGLRFSTLDADGLRARGALLALWRPREVEP